MAKLFSEDSECQSWFEIQAGKIESRNFPADNTTQTWQHISLELHSGLVTLLPKDDPRKACFVCRQPHDEMKKLQ